MNRTDNIKLIKSYFTNNLDKSCLSKIEFDDKYTNYVKILKNNLVFEMSEKHFKQFMAGGGSEIIPKGNTPAKMNASYSSSALAYNVFAHFDLENIDKQVYDNVDFEVKFPVINGKNGKVSCANLDVVLKSKDDIAFIEGKYLELFSDKKYKISSSYFNPKNYLFYDDIIKKEFMELFKIEYTSFDSHQIIKHLIGIYTDYINNPDKYSNYKTMKFYNLYLEIPNEWIFNESVKETILTNILEGIDFESKINKFIKQKLKINNFKFEFMSYNNFVKKNINDIDTIEYFNIRYTHHN